MGGSAHLNYTAGGLVAAGGAAGFARAGSVMSLVGGGACGGLLIGAGYIISTGEDFTGHALGLAGSTVLSASMGARFMNTGKFMPAGVAAALGVVVAVYNAKKAADYA